MANNAAEGNRILILNAKREETKRKQQRDRDSIHEANKVRVSNIDAQFTSKTDNVDDLLVQNTVGLVSAKEFSKRRASPAPARPSPRGKADTGWQALRIPAGVSCARQGRPASQPAAGRPGQSTQPPRRAGRSTWRRSWRKSACGWRRSCARQALPPPPRTQRSPSPLGR